MRTVNKELPKTIKIFQFKLSLCSTFTQQYREKREKGKTRFRRNSVPF